MILTYALVVLLVVIDQISKIIVVENMNLYEQVIFIKPLLNFRFTYNTGAAWSILSDCRWLLALISIAASAALLFLIKNINWKKDRIYNISMVLITSGAIGNFLEFGFMDFPIFNIADTFLTIGVFMIMFYVIFISKDGNLPFMENFRKKTKGDENGLS